MASEAWPMNPYEAPKADLLEQAEGLGESGFRSFRRDPSRLTATLKAFLWTSMIVHLLCSVSAWMSYTLLTGGSFTEPEVDAMNTRESVLNLLQMGVVFTTAFIFLKWIYRANLNARGFNAEDMEISPGWAIGYYFVPFVCLWKPYQSMKEIWQVSSYPPGWRKEPGSGVLTAWWTLWLISSVMGQAVFHLASTAKTLEDYVSLTRVEMAAEVTSAVLCLVALRLVSRIYAMQRTWVEGSDAELGPA